jgi:hypothetical protein
MNRPSWAVNLPDNIYQQILRIIKVIPGFATYIEQEGRNNMIDMAQNYIRCLSYEEMLTIGIQTNLELICDIIRRQGSISPIPIEKWDPQPLWASNLNHEELDYLNTFIIQVSELSSFLKERYGEKNLIKLILEFQDSHKIPYDRSTSESEVIGVIKERYNRIIAQKTEAIHLVDNNLIIDDHSIIMNYVMDAKENFYNKNLDSNPCEDFLNKYMSNFNLYAAFEITDRLLRFEKVPLALPFLKKACSFIFSSPNMYWHNKEDIYGCAILSYELMELIGIRRMLKIQEDSPEVLKKITQSIYLLLSRVIYWEDVQSKEKESYDDKLLPINVQHKLRAYQLRAELTQCYYPFLQSDVSQEDFNLMSIADRMSAHYLSYAFHLVGEDSLFKQKVNKMFETLRIPHYDNRNEAIKKGWLELDKLSQKCYKNYQEGKYFLDSWEIEDFFEKNRLINRTKDIHLTQIINVDISKTPEFSINHSFKKDSKEIKDYLESKGIRYFYHFTEISRIESIIRYGGILSYKQCFDKNIVIPVTEDMAKTRDIDAKKGLEDFARLSFCKYLPKIDIRKKKYSDVVLLKISTDVALFENTEFSNMEATQDGMEHGPTLNDLKKVNIELTQQDYCSPNDPNYWAYQAEILVKGKIPINCILNIHNPEIL